MGEVGTLSVAVMVWRLRRHWKRVGDSWLWSSRSPARTLYARGTNCVRASIRDSQRTCARTGTLVVSEKVGDFWGIFFRLAFLNMTAEVICHIMQILSTFVSG